MLSTARDTKRMAAVLGDPASFIGNVFLFNRAPLRITVSIGAIDPRRSLATCFQPHARRYPDSFPVCACVVYWLRAFNRTHVYAPASRKGRAASFIGNVLSTALDPKLAPGIWSLLRRLLAACFQPLPFPRCREVIRGSFFIALSPCGLT